MKRNKFYYHDKKHDLTEYIETGDTTVACWVNNYLTLLFPIDCTDFTPENIIGFQINGFTHILQKAEEQFSEGLSPEQAEAMNRIFKDLDWKNDGHTKKTRISIEQTMDPDKGNPID